MKDNFDVWIASYDVAVRRSALHFYLSGKKQALTDFIVILAEKYLQAVQALNHAKALKPEDPELHIRIVEIRKTGMHRVVYFTLASSVTHLSSVSSLPQVPPTPIGPLLTESLSALLPDEVALDTFNSQYLQKYPSSASAVLAVAKTSHNLEAAREEVENIVFTTLVAPVELDIKVMTRVLDV